MNPTKFIFFSFGFSTSVYALYSTNISPYENVQIVYKHSLAEEKEGRHYFRDKLYVHINNSSFTLVTHTY